MYRDKHPGVLLPILAALGAFCFQLIMIYFTDCSYICAIACFVLDALITYLLIGHTYSFMPAFFYLLVTELASCGFTLWVVLGSSTAPFFYSWIYILIISLHFMAVFIVCTANHMADRAGRTLRYNSFFVLSGICLIAVLIASFIMRYFVAGQAFPYKSDGLSPYIPVIYYANAINAIILNTLSLTALALYTVIYILFFIPVGFYVHAILNRKPFILKLLVYILIPAAIEGIQFFLLPGSVLMDDVVIALIGELIGSVCFHVLDSMSLKAYDMHFLARKDNFTFYR